MLEGFWKLMVRGVMTTDLKVLGLLKQEGVFECHQTWRENQQQAFDRKCSRWLLRLDASEMHGERDLELHGAGDHGDRSQRPGAAQARGHV